ncbi:MAG TPA: DUF2336 domain-containing protein [Stellaceae bacterium]|nr:DUF2336 domain-containing protein [Stellaceae bacterium]
MGRTDELPRAAFLTSLDEANWIARAKCAERVAALYCQGQLDAVERGLAEETFRLLCYDGEVVVRRLLAECLKRVPNLPPDIAMRLATDKSEIAVPFIAESPSLSDRDLLAILHEYPGPHRIAVATRERVSAPVSDALCRCDDATTIIVTLGNDDAAVAPGTLLWLLDKRPGRLIAGAIAQRRLLPLTVCERLSRGIEDRFTEPSDFFGAMPELMAV